MAIPAVISQAVRDRYLQTEGRFSLQTLRRKDRDLDSALAVNDRFPSEQAAQDVYRIADRAAASFLAFEARRHEQIAWCIWQENNYVPAPEDDNEAILLVTESVDRIFECLKHEIAQVSGYDAYASYQMQISWHLPVAYKAAKAEVDSYVRLHGELLRLESDTADLGIRGPPWFQQQVRIQNLFLQHFQVLQHPFDPERQQKCDRELLADAVRLISFVVFKEVDEFRLSGFGQKFVALVVRYLSCSRESAGPLAVVAEQLCILVEPFLKKCAFLFFPDRRSTPGDGYLWHKGLEVLIRELGISNVDLSKHDISFWKTESVENALLREAFRGRHTAAHEAQTRPLHESERLAYCALASLVVSCVRLLKHEQVGRIVGRQCAADGLRDLFPLIEELGRYAGPRDSEVPSRLERLLEVTSRAKVIWPGCSPLLAQLLTSEYLDVRDELEDADRESYLQSVMEDMAQDYY